MLGLARALAHNLLRRMNMIETEYPTEVRATFEPSDGSITIVQDGKDGIKVISVPRPVVLSQAMDDWFESVDG